MNKFKAEILKELRAIRKILTAQEEQDIESCARIRARYESWRKGYEARCRTEGPRYPCQSAPQPESTSCPPHEA